jgi:arylsulfatase A-like enzyme
VTPGLCGGATRDQLVGLNDVCATLCDAAGIDVTLSTGLEHAKNLHFRR